MGLRRGVSVVGVAAAALFGASVAPAAGPHVCSGKLQSPGVLKGTYPHGAVVKGFCAVKNGRAHVIGTVTVTPGSTFAAAFGAHGSRLIVTGDVVVQNGATAVIGCKVNPNGSGFPCIDDPNMKHPTLTSHASVSGSIIGHSPLGVIVHNSSIAGDIKQAGGGGGLSCATPKSGPFAAIMSPVYSDYEDSSVGGGVSISGLSSCWLGVARMTIRGNLTVANNTMGDPDAIEVVLNHIHKNLACRGNSHPSPSAPGAQPVWDSAETSQAPGVIYPRTAQPNTVGGKRSGQCVRASPATAGGPPGSGKF